MNNDSNQAPQTPETKRSLLRTLWRIFLFVLVSAITLIGSAVFLTFYYQNEVKEFIIGELNKQLNTEIVVDGKDIDLTIIKSFPMASLDFKNVKALDAVKTEKKDTLFKAEVVSLQFNIIDIFNKNYHIKKIVISNADIHLRIDKQGNDNYHFWKSSAQTDTTNFSFALENIVMENSYLSYQNDNNKHYYSITINKSIISGNFSAENYALQSESELFIKQIKINNTKYLRKKNVSATIYMNVDNTTETYSIEKGKIQIENMAFSITGDAQYTNNLALNLNIKGQDMDIQSVLSIIPNEYKSTIANYESTGNFYFNAAIKGKVSAKYTPIINAEFGIANAEIKNTSNNITLTNVNLSGKYSNGNKASMESSTLNLNEFSARVNNGNIKGNFSLTNFDNPHIQTQLQADIRLEELQKLIPIDTIENITGQLKMNILFDGKWADVNASNYDKFKTQGNLLVNDVNLKIKNNNLNFKNINGDFDFNNNDLIINAMNGSVSESDFELQGRLFNSTGFMLKENQDITVVAKFYSKHINLNELLADKQEHTTAEKGNYKLRFSEHINVNLDSEIDHIEFRKFEAENLKGTIVIKNKRLMVDPIKFYTMDGNIKVSGIVDGSDSTRVDVTCDADVNGIDISKLYTAFENFGQNTITDKNIKGIATANIQLSALFSPELEMDTKKLIATVDMTIENGELNNVESMKSLSRFIELNELNSVKFSTLKNTLEIRNKIVYLPKMEINSSAMNIYLSGSHTFDNVINYKIKLSLNELLSKKIRKNKKENTDFGEIADDGLKRSNIFLTMTGTVDNPIIKYDTKSAVQNIKQDIKQEKQTLKAILKEELGLFKKDTTLNKKNTPPAKFNIKWEEEEKAEEEHKTLKIPKKKIEDDY